MKVKIISPPASNKGKVDHTPLPNYMPEADIVINMGKGYATCTRGGKSILDGLNRGFAEHNFNLRWLLRILTQLGGYPSDLKIKVYEPLQKEAS